MWRRIAGDDDGDVQEFARNTASTKIKSWAMLPVIVLLCTFMLCPEYSAAVVAVPGNRRDWFYCPPRYCYRDLPRQHLYRRLART